MCGCSVREIRYSDYKYNSFLLRFSVDIFVDLVKHGVFTLVGEIRH